jgi:hypothetical protein
MEKHTFVVFDEIIQGVILGSDEAELDSKIKILLGGVRPEIKTITLPSFNDFNDMEPHEVTVEYENDAYFECFFVQRVNPV